MTRITDHFKVGDKVKWITIRYAGNAIEIKQREGFIDAIEGSRAVISSPDFKRRRRVSLFELEVIP